MRFARFLAVTTIVLTLFGCGGGGGGGDSAVSATVPPSSTCPIGGPAPGGDTSKCATIGPATTPALTDINPVAVFTDGFSLPFNGTIDPASVTAGNVKLWLGADGTGTPVAGTPTLSADGKTVTFTPVQRPEYGTTYTLTASVKDTVGHSAGWTAPFTTVAMSCNAITGVSTAAQTTWSNPAIYSSVLRGCVALKGEQVQLDPAYNKMDASCVVPVIGQPLSDACKTQVANGTIVFAETDQVVNSHLVTLAFANGSDGLGKLMALDTNDPTNANPLVVASVGFSSALKQITGNSTGAFVCTTDGNGSQVTVDSANNLAVTRIRGC